MARRKRAKVTPIKPMASPESPDITAPGNDKTITLDALAEWVRRDGRKRIIITMDEAGTSIDWERCAWVGMPIAMALSLVIDFLPGYRALEQSAVYGLVPPNGQEAVPQPPGGAIDTKERKDA